jgi:hypothetical protein
MTVGDGARSRPEVRNGAMTPRRRGLAWTGGLVGSLLLATIAIGLGALWVFRTLLDARDRDPAVLRAQWRTPFPDDPTPATAPPPDTETFGSGHFGAWIRDRFGLPAYAYTCDQRKEPRAISPVNPAWQSPTNHWHQVGNDRLVALASNEGYVQVRADEGGPRVLNDFDPKRGHYAGGFGYLSDGTGILSTYYPGHAESFDRVFGLGYVEKRAQARGLVVDHVVFAPFGDDPLLLSNVSIENRRSEPVDVRWVEYWGTTPYPLSYRSLILSLFTGGRSPASELRRSFAASFSHEVEQLGDGTALVDRERFRGERWKLQTAWVLAESALSLFGRGLTGGVIRPPVPEVWYDDRHPAPTFLASLDAPADAVSAEGARFFGKGGVASPDGMSAPLPGLGAGSDGTALLMERRLHLQPGGRRTLHFAYGYLPEGASLERLVETYRTELASVWEISTRAWDKDRISLVLPGESWVDRELLWDTYYLRSDLTYDDFFREHILSQGHVYQYLMGFQGAARDPLQHALPFVYFHPETAREVLRYTLEEVGPTGEIPYGMVGHGMVMPAPYRPSDQELWLLWLASEYVLATRDTSFLDEEVPTWPRLGPSAPLMPVQGLLDRCYRHLVDVTGTGRHGLLRLSNGDWNDAAVLGFVPRDQVGAVRKEGESVLNAAFASYVLEHYARMLEFVGDPERAAEARHVAEGQREAVRRQWTGRWFRREWLNETLGWVGDDVLWLEPQPWAIIGGAATPEQQQTLVESIDRALRAPSPIGARLQSAPLRGLDVPPGELVNAGVWPSIDGTLVWALARADPALAWDEWKKNTLARHAESYPDVWYGIWSGPDTYNSTLSSRPGQTYVQPPPPGRGVQATLSWTDFPVMNMHPHAWPLYDVVKLLGIEFAADGVEMAPALPQASYAFASPLVGLTRSPAGYSGWYAPLGSGEWTVRLRLPAADVRRLSSVTVDGSPTRLLSEDGWLDFRGESRPDNPLRWTLE